MAENLKFVPLSFSWVAIHPEPKGVIQFIGGAFFGTFPTLFYRYFFEKLYEEGYTIIALPFRFSFRHWPIAISLLKEQETLQKELLKITCDPLYRDNTKYFWIGHSLGCKYITLLEFISSDQWQQIVKTCVNEQTLERIETIISGADLEKTSILGQGSLLIAPDISDTESAFPGPAKPIAQLLDLIGLGVLPTRQQTQRFIQRSNLFNLTALISFKCDTIAGSVLDRYKNKKTQDNSDVLWFFDYLENKPCPILHEEMPGKHLEPLGARVGDYVVDLNPFDKFIEPLKNRLLERYSIKFLGELDNRS